MTISPLPQIDTVSNLVVVVFFGKAPAATPKLPKTYGVGTADAARKLYKRAMTWSWTSRIIVRSPLGVYFDTDSKPAPAEAAHEDRGQTGYQDEGSYVTGAVGTHEDDAGPLPPPDDVTREELVAHMQAVKAEVEAYQLAAIADVWAANTVDGDALRAEIDAEKAVAAKRAAQAEKRAAAKAAKIAALADAHVMG